MQFALKYTRHLNHLLSGTFIMRLRIHAIALVTVLSFCSTSDSNTSRIDSGNKAISTSPEGLARFFLEECIKQRNSAWVRAEYKRLQEGCWGDSQCLDELPSEIKWKVSTTNKMTIEISYEWRHSRTPPNGLIACSISTSDDLRRNLRNSVAHLEVNGHSFRKFNNFGAIALVDYPIEGWEADQKNEAFLMLEHFLPLDAVELKPSKNPNAVIEHDTVGINSARIEFLKHAKHPWKLKYGQKWDMP